MRTSFIIVVASLFASFTNAQQINIGGKPSQIDIAKAGENGIRITIKPVNFNRPIPFNPVFAETKMNSTSFSIHSLNKVAEKRIGNFIVEIYPSPFKLIIRNKKMQLIQELIFNEEGNISFNTGNAPVLGMGEGGPKPNEGEDWRFNKIQFDRRGVYDSMQPRWQANAYGSRNPVPLLIGTKGWCIFVAAPWVQVDLRDNTKGVFIPWKPGEKDRIPQNEKDQGLVRSKGLPPAGHVVPGLYDLFVFDAHDPLKLMKDINLLTGKAVMPPRWSLGYMQSHRLLENETQIIGIADTFRAKKIPLDAVIYLGTGFTPKGWNKQQPSFEFNPEVFQRNPSDFLADMHSRNTKVVLHMVPWDRDILPVLDDSVFKSYWQPHSILMKQGVDGWWPDEGDWFNLFERMKRHQFYYLGPLSTEPGVRPWSLHRNGFLGIAKWGGWVWSGDTESSWKTLEGQIGVGINHSLSLSPYWGSDIGGFYPNEELTGELYARWFQFGAFCPSFRSHGRTWWTRLPWGWGSDNMGPKENKENPLQSEMNNKLIEPIAKQYDELRYQLLPYNYTLAWEARSKGLPLMRSLWLYYPNDSVAQKTGDEYLWGRDMLIAPVYQKGATTRSVYLPDGNWYDWFTNSKEAGGKTVLRNIDLATMPIYIRAGSIIPMDPVRQYTDEKIAGSLTIRIYSGEDGYYTFYEDDGKSQDYLKRKYSLTEFTWNNKSRKLTIKAVAGTEALAKYRKTIFKIELLPEGIVKEVNWKNAQTVVSF